MTNATKAMEGIVRLYTERGWTGIVPLPPGKKASPPDDTTGAGGVDLTVEEVLDRLQPGGNIGLRMPDGVVGIDCDAYVKNGRLKTGDITIHMLEYDLGKLPPSPWLTARKDGKSGIRFFRVPKGTELGTIGSDVDTIRRSFRYAVAAPSLNPETGTVYRWLDPDGNPCEPPYVADLPELPQSWREAFPYEGDDEDETEAGTGTKKKRRGTGVNGKELIKLGKRWWSELPPLALDEVECASVADTREEGVLAAGRKGLTQTARHDLLKPLLKLCLQADAGCPGVREAIAQVGRVYVALPGGEDHPEKFWHELGSTVDRLGSFDPFVCHGFTRDDEILLRSIAVELASQEPQEDALDDWTPMDLGPFLDGTSKRPEPVYCQREDGACLFYKGRLNVVFGESESGKSWLGFVALAERLMAGEVVGMVDYEDGVEGAIYRLRDVLGVPTEVLRTQLRYINPDSKVNDAKLREWVADCTVVLIDATTEALAAEGLSSNSDVDVAAFYALLPKRISRLGPAVILVDHVTKTWEGQGQQTGSQHKKAGVDGTSVKVENVVPFVEGDYDGLSRLLVAKDRNSGVRKNSIRVSGSRLQVFADFRITPSGSSLEAPVPPPSKKEKDETAALVLRTQVLDLVLQEGPLKTITNARQVIRGNGISGGNDVLSAVLHKLVKEGQITPDFGPQLT